MIYLYLKTKDPYYNLAVEEYLFRNANDDVFMLWQNEPSVIVGKNQNAYAEVELKYAEENGIHVCRRITGGGAVYHDLGNINYSFISTRGTGSALDFEYFTRPIRKALLGLGINATLGGRNDIECDGRKISGNAQHAENGRILHHGTLLFNTDSEVMSRVLRVDKEKLEFRAVKSCSARVVNLSELLGSEVSIAQFISEIEKSVCRELSATPGILPENEKIEALAERNRSADWIFSDKRFLNAYTIKRKKKYPFGIVEIELQLEAGIIKNVVILGDFFGKEPIEKLESLLLGMNPDSLKEIDPSPYVNGMSFEELLELVRP